MKTALIRAGWFVIGMGMAMHAVAAVDVFLKLDGIEGESTAKGHEKWIEIDSFSLGATHTPTSGGQSTGKTELSPVTITQAIDSSTPQEFLALATGKRIATGILDLVAAGGDQRKIFEYTFSDILLTSIDFSGSSGGNPVESLSFVYDKIKLQAFAQGPKGDSIPLPPVEFSLLALAPAPEPSTWALLAVGLAAIAMRGARRLRT
jgi:type VI secretion system secreted protein Hcp